MIRAALEPDKATLSAFLGAMFRHADKDTYISLRAFEDGRREQPPLFIDGVKVGRPELLDWTFNRAKQAARHEKTANFCPPVATFDNQKKAEEKNVANGVGLSVECDEAPGRARKTLTSLLGEPTLTCASGGEWTDPATGEVEPKLHLHWRLTEPTRTAEDHAKLKRARKLACTLVGADATGVPINHPFRWPGSVHRKGEPKLASIVVETENEIELADALEKLEMACPDVQPDRARAFGDFAKDALRGDLVDIASALAVIPNGDEKWVHWNHIGMATWKASAGRAFAAFDAWSQKSGKYDAGATVERWNHYTTSPPTEVGAGTLYRLARKVLPSWRRPTLIARDAERAEGGGFRASEDSDAGGTYDSTEALRDREQQDRAEREYARQAHEDHWGDPGFQGRFDEDPPPGDKPAEPSFKIVVTPFVWRDPKTFPRRRWLYGHHLIRKFISCTVAPGGLGKSSLVLVEAIALVTGRALLGVHPSERRLTVWVLNLEDPQEEIERRVIAILIHYKIDPSEIDGRLFVDSGRHLKLIVVEATRAGTVIARPVVDAFTAEVRARKVDVVVIDPFVKSHRVPENDNGAIDTVATVFADIADACDCAIDLVHHVRKTGGAEVTVEDGRGAVALLGAVRSARALNGMTKGEAETLGEGTNAREFFRVANGKLNMAPPPPDRADWYRLVSVPLGNGSDDPTDKWSIPSDDGDKVQCVVGFEWPDMMESVTVAHLRATQAIVATGEWKEAIQAKEKWVGYAVAQAMKLDWENRNHRATIKAALAAWYASGMLVKVRRKDKNSEDRTFVEVGERATD